MRIGKRLIATCLLLASMIGASVFAIMARSATPSPPVTVTEWPALTLTYQLDERANGLSGGVTTKVWKLSYQDSHHWRKELLQDTANPGKVGSVESFQGRTYTEESALLKHTFTKVYDNDVPVVPEQWLMPGREPALVTKGYAKNAASAGQEVYAMTESMACQADDPQAPVAATGNTQPATCAKGKTYDQSETITYRTDLHIPIEVVNRTGGVITRHATITQLTLG